MPSIQVETQLSHNKLLETIGQFTQTELDQFVAEVITLRAKRQAPSLSRRESELLAKINQHLTAELQARFDELVAKRQDESLTTAEHEELITLTEPVERIDVEGIEALAQLAKLREISVDELMNQLGIKPPECDF
jgi:hypothetical protein